MFCSQKVNPIVHSLALRPRIFLPIISSIVSVFWKSAMSSLRALDKASLSRRPPAIRSSSTRSSVVRQRLPGKAEHAERVSDRFQSGVVDQHIDPKCQAADNHHALLCQRPRQVRRHFPAIGGDFAAAHDRHA
jgi:hypothetical protein